MTEPFNPPYEGATLAQLQNENVQIFLNLHAYLRNELKMMLALIEDLTDEAVGETAELPKVKSDLRQLGDSLRSHLDYEETHVCPLLTHWTSAAKFYGALFRG